MIVLFSDFGLSGPYVGQMKAVLHHHAPGMPVVDLFADAPVHNIRSNAYLLAAYAESFPVGSVFLAVVDPGVGSITRAPVVLRSGGRWYVGPGNGLFDLLAKRDPHSELWEILWRPPRLSNSFHGRDLFAPVAAMLAVGEQPELKPLTINWQQLSQLADELYQIIYIDHFGNLVTGIRAASLPPEASLRYRGQRAVRANTFADVAVGQSLCYENANGLLEIAINQGRADGYFGAAIGDPLEVVC